MVLQIINNSEKTIDLSINDQCIQISKTYELETDAEKFSISIAYHDTSSSISEDHRCFIDTKISFELLCSNDSILLLSNRVRQYQNHTQYSFFIPQCNNGKISNIRHSVTGQNHIHESMKQYRKLSRTSRLFSVLTSCFFNAILDGGLLFLILWLVFNVKIAMICLAIVFIFELIAESIFRKLNKSRRRFLNRAKGTDSFDDVEYLIRHIQKFCK